VLSHRRERSDIEGEAPEKKDQSHSGSNDDPDQQALMEGALSPNLERRIPLGFKAREKSTGRLWGLPEGKEQLE